LAPGQGSKKEFDKFGYLARGRAEKVLKMELADDKS
jgi:hypothetical protein